jgi:hypothetical protein
MGNALPLTTDYNFYPVKQCSLYDVRLHKKYYIDNTVSVKTIVDTQ